MEKDAVASILIIFLLAGFSYFASLRIPSNPSATAPQPTSEDLESNLNENSESPVLIKSKRQDNWIKEETEVFEEIFEAIPEIPIFDFVEDDTDNGNQEEFREEIPEENFEPEKPEEPEEPEIPNNEIPSE